MPCGENPKVSSSCKIRTFFSTRIPSLQFPQFFGPPKKKRRRTTRSIVVASALRVEQISALFGELAMSSSEKTPSPRRTKLVLHFHIRSAKNIKSSRTRRKRLLFVLEVGDKLKFRTKIAKKTENPIWDERGTMDLGPITNGANASDEEKVRLSVWDVKTKTKQKCKGARSIWMKDVKGGFNLSREKEKKIELDVELEGCTRGVGSVQVELMFVKEEIFVEDAGERAAEEKDEDVFKTPALKVKEEITEEDVDENEDENEDEFDEDPSKEELLRERVKKMQMESMEKKLERMEDPDMLTKEERRMLTEGASVAKNLGAKLPKYFDDASRAGGLPSSVEKKEKEEEEDEWANVLPTKKNKSGVLSMSPVKKAVSGDSIGNKDVDEDSLGVHLLENQPSSPTVIPERKDVISSSNILSPTGDKSNSMNELRRKQSSERIHARAIAAREALRQSKSSQINDELDELYERVVVSPSSGGKENTSRNDNIQMATSETVDAKKPSSFSSYSEDDEEDEEENIVIYYLEKSKPMTLAEAEMLRDAKKVSQLMQRAENAFTKWM